MMLKQMQALTSTAHLNDELGEEGILRRNKRGDGGRGTKKVGEET
jgi:hypothetical protein